MTNELLRIGLIGVGGICAGVHYPGLTRIPGVEIAGPLALKERLRAVRAGQPGQPAGADITGVGLHPSVEAVDDPVERRVSTST